MADLVWAAFIIVFGLSGLIVLDVCFYLVSENGRYDLHKLLQKDDGK